MMRGTRVELHHVRVQETDSRGSRLAHRARARLATRRGRPSALASSSVASAAAAAASSSAFIARSSSRLASLNAANDDGGAGRTSRRERGLRAGLGCGRSALTVSTRWRGWSGGAEGSVPEFRPVDVDEDVRDGGGDAGRGGLLARSRAFPAAFGRGFASGEAAGVTFSRLYRTTSLGRASGEGARGAGSGRWGGRRGRLGEESGEETVGGKRRRVVGRRRESRGTPGGRRGGREAVWSGRFERDALERKCEVVDGRPRPGSHPGPGIVRLLVRTPMAEKVHRDQAGAPKCASRCAPGDAEGHSKATTLSRKNRN